MQISITRTQNTNPFIMTDPLDTHFASFVQCQTRPRDEMYLRIIQVLRWLFRFSFIILNFPTVVPGQDSMTGNTSGKISLAAGSAL
jgi:hypothetical protein